MGHGTPGLRRVRRDVRVVPGVRAVSLAPSTLATGRGLTIKIWRNYLEATLQASNRRFWLRWFWLVLVWFGCGLTPIVKGDITGGWRVVGIVVFGLLLFVLVLDAAIRLRYRALRTGSS
jgi:hypothetical protein